MLLRDGGCAFPGCERPPRHTDIHHIQPWQHGGPTNQDNAVALCRHHHQLIHHSDWTIRIGPDHRPDFIPPTHIDPTQTPRRNPYHQRR
ncbi:MAG TPA: HNH endonuclease signature motif containing protein [Micromonosporaceae bacterium]|nr:HNH endonuclease signature motif containing protein [Micromonosporaceae bacterium]